MRVRPIQILKLFGLLLGLAAIFGLWVLWQIQRTTITVENLLDVPIDDVTVIVNGDEEAVGRIDPGGARLVSISPGSESDVTLRWTQGGEATSWTGGYVEPRMGFRMDWTLEPAGVKWDQWTWPDW